MKIIYLIVIISALLSCCSESPIHKESLSRFNDRSINDVGFGKSMETLIDSFIMSMGKYSDDINLVGYVKIIDANDNKTFKICLQGIESEKFFSKINVDDYFVKSGFYFCIDYNINNLLKTEKNNLEREFIKNSKISDYRAADTKMPTWLIEIQNDTIIRINKYANSVFEPKQNRIGYFTTSGVKEYRLTEWGEVIDDDGNIIDTYDGKK